VEHVAICVRLLITITKASTTRWHVYTTRDCHTWSYDDGDGNRWLDYEVVIAGIDAISGSMVCRDSENLLKWIII
jgi:hypothetical protein